MTAPPTAGETAQPESPPSRRARLTPLARGLLLAFVLSLLISALCRPRFPLYPYELKTIDSRFRLRAEAPAPSHTVIVAIDERSLNDPRLGRWPWDRRWHAQLIRRLMVESPAAIAFDVIFAEPSSLASDTQLASAIAASRRVYLGLHAADLAGRTEATRFAIEPALVTSQHLLPQVGSVVGPLPQFAQGAAGGGLMAAVPDADGVVRRVFLLTRETHSRRLYPTLLLSLAAAQLRAPIASLRFNLKTGVSLTPRVTVPFDGSGNALVNFPGPADTIPTLSYVDVLDGRFAPDAFRGKVVLVGFTAPGLLDQYPTPLSPTCSGVEIQAQTLEGLLAGRFLEAQGFANALGLALVLSLLSAVLATSTRPTLGLAAVVLMLGAYNVASLHAFGAGSVWPALAPNLSAVLTFATLAVFRLATEEAGRKRLRDEFGRYAPPQVVARLDAGEMKERAAGDKREVTSLFADVRGFTAWSASADPHDVIAVLNTYYEAMTQLAFDVEGTVDNIVGDEIFVTFNALEDQPDHRERAVDLALNMVAALDGLNQAWLVAGRLPAPLRIGVGINSGEALVGSLGSRVRTQYTVLGQSVNLAARLQAFNKDLGTMILVTSEVADAVSRRVQLRSHGLKEIRGHPVPVEVVEVQGRLEATRAESAG